MLKYLYNSILKKKNQNCELPLKRRKLDFSIVINYFILKLYNFILKLMILGCMAVAKLEQAGGLHGVQDGLGRYWKCYFH
jgi:hypothetical protein